MVSSVKLNVVELNTNSSICLGIVFENLENGAAYIDSDTGLESMSSAEATTKACSVCLEETNKTGGSTSPSEPMISSRCVDLIGMNSAETEAQIQRLSQDVTTLKNDKLDLLRQNVVSLLKHISTRSIVFITLVSLLDDRLANEKSNTCVSTSYPCKAIWQRLAKRFCDFAIY